MSHALDAIEALDACVFSGDLLYIPNELTELKHHLERWQRAVAEREKLLAETGE